MLRLLIIFWVVHLATVSAAIEFAAPRQVDERRAAQVGLRKIVGRHLRLYTDLPPSDGVDSLPVVFDAAVPLWAEYFQVDVAKLRNWRMQGYLIEDRAKFAALGLLPKEKPDFINGYSNGNELWLMEQPSDYFRRHLLLHEGSHGFMAMYSRDTGQLGDTGSGWYMEGMAELFGTHRWYEGKLSLRTMPASRAEVPMWGRIKLIREAHRAGTPLDLQAILTLKKRRAFSTNEYAWCWALCQFLDSHPRWQEKFQQLPKHIEEKGFNKRFQHDFQAEWPELLTEWRAFVATLDYGYDNRRMAMQHVPISPITDKASATLAADRSWQSTGWLLEAGKAYRVTAEGHYQISDGQISDGQISDGQIADNGSPWPCEPGGVTLEYHAGQPLGKLLGAWRSPASNQFSEPFAVGLAAKLTPTEDAVLYLRVNDSPARLSDNRGTLDVSIRRAAD